MNRKRLLVSKMLLFCLILAACKSSDPAPVACKITFKGKNYGLSLATCETDATEQYMNGADANPNPSQTLTIIKSTNAAIDQIEFIGSVSDLDTYYSTIKNASTPTITISGKTWTFSGTVENTIGDKGEISGTCTCK